MVPKSPQQLLHYLVLFKLIELINFIMNGVVVTKGGGSVERRDPYKSFLLSQKYRMSPFPRLFEYPSILPYFVYQQHHLLRSFRLFLKSLLQI